MIDHAIAQHEPWLLSHNSAGKNYIELNAMLNFLKRKLKERGVMASPYASRADLQATIKKLHPVTTGVPLVRVGNASDAGYLAPDDLEGLGGMFFAKGGSGGRFRGSDGWL